MSMDLKENYSLVLQNCLSDEISTQTTGNSYVLHGEKLETEGGKACVPVHTAH